MDIIRELWEWIRANPQHFLIILVRIAVRIILFCIVVKVILRMIRGPKRRRYGNYQPNYQRSQPRPPAVRQPQIRTIEDCYSSEDIQYHLQAAEQEVVDAVERNRQQIAQVLQQANSTIDTAWLSSCKKVLNISNTLDNNLAYHAQRNLQEGKFQYYAQLHFRSMIAADIVHREFEKVDASFREMNSFIVRMKGNPAFQGGYKSQVYNNKDLLKSIRQVYLQRVNQMNMKTGTLRDQIGNECGRRGYEWWLERTRHQRA